MTEKKKNNHSQLAWPLGPAKYAAAAMIRYDPPSMKSPIAIFVTVDGSFDCFDWRAHKATTNGVNAKIMKGLKAWNHVTGISMLMRPGMSLRSVKFCAQRLMVLPCCS